MKTILLACLFVALASQAMAKLTHEHYEHATIAAYHPKWLECENSDQCVIVPGRNCNYQFAVNKDYADKAQTSEEVVVSCLKPYSLPPNVEPKCIERECVIAIPDEVEKRIDKFPRSQPKPLGSGY